LEWGGNGEGEVSSLATWGQGGRDGTTQEEGFQVSKRELARGISKGPRLHLILLICVYISYHCLNAANKRMCLGYK
jgi:hypothetical protein